ncbi:MAG: hypothetical protein ACYSWQ_18115 [Planctomycetota bacterium]
MTAKLKNLGIITSAVALIIKAVIMAGRFSGAVRKRSLRRLAAMDADTKDKEILFLKDKLYQLQTQVSILQKRVRKHQKKPRYGPFTFVLLLTISLARSCPWLH